MIVPYPSARDVPRQSSQSSLKRVVGVWIRRLLRLWAALHISYRGGRYSVERLLALEEYTKSTSLWRVVLVFATFPVPSTAFLIAQEAVPLQDPAEGWQANYGFWLRAVIICSDVFYTILVQLKDFFQTVHLSQRQILLAVVLTGCVQTGIAAVTAAYAFFPIPFCVITMVPVFYIVMVVSFCVVVGVPVAREILKDAKQFLRFTGFIGVQQLMAAIYPAYQVLFHAVVDTDYELSVILLLPIIKLVVKYVALRCVTHMEDMMPEAVIFTVDFFNALYLATSMENASSALTVAIIVFIDVLQTSIVLYRLHRRTRTIMTRMQRATRVQGDCGSLLNEVCCLCRSAEIIGQNRQGVSIQSCLPHQVSPRDRDTLHRLKIIPLHNGDSDGHNRCASLTSRIAIGPTDATRQKNLQAVQLKKKASTTHDPDIL